MTEAEAREYYDYYVHQKGDWQAVRNLAAGAVGNMQSADATDPAMLEALLALVVLTFLYWTARNLEALPPDLQAATADSNLPVATPAPLPHPGPLQQLFGDRAGYEERIVRCSAVPFGCEDCQDLCDVAFAAEGNDRSEPGFDQTFVEAACGVP